MHYKEAIGQTLDLTVAFVHGPESRLNGQAHARLSPFSGLGKWETSADGRLPMVSGTTWEPKQVIAAKVLDVFFMENMNGGRTNTKQYSSPEEYWEDPKVKAAVMRIAYGNLGARIAYSGNPDRLDMCVLVELTVGQHCTLTATLWDSEAPLTWYAEKFQDDERFKFPEGFFSDAHEAIEFFQDDASEDLFGDRRFPVLVFPADATTVEQARDIAGGAKGMSNTLILHGSIIIGTRCKMCEYADVIYECYHNGGKVAKNLRWDWD